MSETNKPPGGGTKPTPVMQDPIFGRSKITPLPGTRFDPHQPSDFTPAAGTDDH